MKIYQITQAKSYNHHQNIHRSNSVNTLASKPYQNAYSCSFKGFEDFKTSLKNGSQNIKNKMQEKFGEFWENRGVPIYEKLVKKSIKSTKPQKVQKEIVPAVKKAADSIIPLPNFSMDYDKVLADLKNIKTIDSKWVKENTPVLKAFFGYKNADMEEHFFKIQAAEINRNRNLCIQSVKDMQAAEKAEYIKAIWDEFLDVNPPFKPMNKEKNLLGLKALQNYGTREDMLKLSRRYQLSEDSDIMKEYAKLVGKVGRVDDCLKVLPYATTNSFKTYNEDAMAEIMKTLKKLMVDDSKPNYWINFEYAQYVQIERLTNHQNKIISENAKVITQRLIEDNPWILE